MNSEPTIQERRQDMAERIVEVEAMLRSDLADDDYPDRLRGKAARTLRDLQRLQRRIGFPADGVSPKVPGGKA